MNLQVIQATGTHRKGVVAMVGIPGSGKTTSALILAYGMLAQKHPELMDDKKRDRQKRYLDYSPVAKLIGVISTEGDRDELSANRIFTNPFDDYAFKIGNHLKVKLGAPYTADNYIAAKNLLKQAGCEVIIVDSASHYWQWVLETQNSIATNNPKSTFSSWQSLQPHTKKFIEAFAYDTDIDVILTMRQKVDYDMTSGAPKRVGAKADMKQDISFEFQVELQIEPKNHTITINKDNSHLFTQGDIIDPVIGVCYQRWLSGKVSDRQVMEIKLSRIVKRSGKERMVNIYTTWANLNQITKEQTTSKDGVISTKPVPTAKLNDIEFARFFEYLTTEMSKGLEMEL